MESDKQRDLGRADEAVPAAGAKGACNGPAPINHPTVRRCSCGAVATRQHLPDLTCYCDACARKAGWNG
jgi:hypothetical protein